MGILPLLPSLLDAFELSRPSKATSYAAQVTGSPVGKGPMGISAAVWTLFERPSNADWTFLIAAVVDVAKESLSFSSPLTESADSVIKPRRLVWLLIQREKINKNPVSSSEVSIKKQAYSAGSNFWMLKSSPILSMVTSIFCIIGTMVSSTVWLIFLLLPIALTLSTVAWRVD